MTDSEFSGDARSACLAHRSYIYLHGFASSPESAKARYLRDRFSSLQIPLKIPDLNQGDFSHLTITRQMQQVAAQFPPEGMPVTLIGSSLGGLTAAWLAEKHSQVQRLVLLAPAFGFLSHWLPKLGEEKLKHWQAAQYILVYHYGQKHPLPLSYDFVIDAAQYREELLQRSIPTLIFHGCHDETIPISASRDFAAKRPWVQLIELDSDHALGNVMAEICVRAAVPLRDIGFKTSGSLAYFNLIKAYYFSILSCCCL